jgi:OPA family sugar phosphate sensor protein UhpC-like MFS transporter
MLAITLGYGLIYTCRLALGVVKKPLIDAGVFSPSELGLIGSALFYTYAIGKLTNGFLSDHANHARVPGLRLPDLGAVQHRVWAFRWSTLWLAVCCGVQRLVPELRRPGGVVAMTHWFSNRERGRFYGIWSTAHSIGEGLTFLVVGALVGALGWQAGFWGPGLIGVLTALGCLFLIQDRPRTLGPAARQRLAA